MSREPSLIPESRWPVAPAWSVVESRDEFGGNLPLLSMSAEMGVRERVAGEGRAASDDTSGYRVVRAGDLVVNKLSARDGAYGVSHLVGLVSPAYWVLRPRRLDLESRWLDYVLRSTSYRAELGRISKSMPPAQFDLPWDLFRLVPIPLPPRRVQQSICDYLDTETARIDALFTKKRKLARLIDEHLETLAHDLLDTVSGVPLRRVAGLLPGYTFPSSAFSPDGDGPLLLRGINIGVGVLRWDEAVRLSGQQDTFSRYRLRSGDLVLGMDRPFIGGGTRVVEIDETSQGSLLVQRVCRIRCHSPQVTALVRWALASRRFRAHVEPDLSGVSVPHLSEGQIGSFRIPSLPEAEVGKRLARLANVEKRTVSLKRALTDQLARLQEHREALITAAVTGELKISGVA